MPALFPRLKVWVANEVLTYTDLNAEFDNILANLEADTLGGYSSTVAQMRLQVNPGGIGSESQAASISGELERIRFAISRIVGKTYWYEAPTKNLATGGVRPRHIFSPNRLDEPLQRNTRDLYRAGILCFDNSDQFASTGSNASGQGKYSDGVLINRAGIGPGAVTFFLDKRATGGSATYSFWMKGFTANQNILINPLIGLRVYLNASGFLQVDIQRATATAGVKDVVSVTGSQNLSGSISFNHVLISYRLTNSSSDSLSVFFNGVQMGTPISGTPIHGNVARLNDGAVFHGVNGFLAPEFSTNMDVVPDSAGWAVTRTGGATASVSGGVLTALNVTGNTQYWSRSPATLSGAFGADVRFKIRLRKENAGGSVATLYSTSQEQAFSLIVRNGTNGTRLNISATSCSVSNSAGLGFGVNSTSATYNHNFTEWTHVVFSVGFADNRTTVFINGKPVLFNAGVGADAAAFALVFGKTQNQVTAIDYDMEYIEYYGGNGALSVIGYLPTFTDNVISDLAVFDGVMSDAGTIASLQTASPFALFGEEVEKKILFNSNMSCEIPGGLSVAAGATSRVPAVVSSNRNVVQFFSDGTTPVNIRCDIDGATVSNAAAQTFTGSLYLEIIPGGTYLISSGVIAGFDTLPDLRAISAAVSGSLVGTAGIVDTVIAQRSIILSNIPANTTMPLNFGTTYSGTLPAGKYTVGALFHNNTSSGVAALIRRCDIVVY
jgi:hypothetical protein